MHRITKAVFIFVLSVLLTGPAAGDDEISRDSDQTNEDLPRFVRKAKKAEQELSKVIQSHLSSFVFIGGGSGVFINKEGHFLTNYHVLAEKLKQERKKGGSVDRVFEVELLGGESRTALIVGMDPLGDLALCKVVDGSGPYDHLEFGNSDELVIGQYVIAIGNPFLRGQFTARPIATFGIIGEKHVFKRRYPDAIQTDAAINPGNSGGPLIDLNGKLIGINGRIETKFGTRANSGVGYALSSNRIQRFLPILRKGGIAFHGNSDLLEQSRTENGFEPTYINDENGTLVLKKDPGKDSQPYKAGLRKGDRIISLGGYTVNNFRRFVGIIRGVPGPNTLKLTFMRDGTKKNTELELEQYGNWENEQLLKTLPVSDEAPYLGIGLSKSDGNLTITKVVEDSPADRAGLKKGDMMLKINDRETPTPESAIRMIQSRWFGEELSLTIKRDGETKTLTAKLGKRKKKNE